MDFPEKKLRHDQVGKLVSPQVDPLRFPQEQVDQQIEDRAAEEEPALFPRNLGVRGNGKRVQKNPVGNQERDTRQGEQEDPHRFTMPK